jgi:hypothetical protein
MAQQRQAMIVARTLSAAAVIASAHGILQGGSATAVIKTWLKESLAIVMRRAHQGRARQCFSRSKANAPLQKTL